MTDIRDVDGVIPSLLIAQHFRKLKLMSEKQPIISCATINDTHKSFGDKNENCKEKS